MEDLSQGTQTIPEFDMFGRETLDRSHPDLAVSRSRQRANFIDYLRLIFAFGIFPNIPFFFAPLLLHVSPRGIVNVEYLAAGVMARLIRRGPVLAVLALVTAFDIFERAIFVFYFSQRDLASSLKYLSLVPVAESLRFLAVLIALAVAVAWSTLKIAPPRRAMTSAREVGCLAATIVLLCIADVAAGTNGILRIRDTRMSVNVASAPAFAVLNALYRSNRRESTAVGPAQDFAGKPLLSFLKNGASYVSSKPNIVMVLVESYGKLISEDAAAALAAFYRRGELSSRYLVEQGVVPFRGGTVSAELRELCGIVGDLSTVPVSNNVSAGCLPALLSKRGYHSTAIHGYVGEMFGRKQWYPKLGFGDSVFLEDLNAHPEVHDCAGFFKGACDADVARFIHSLLLAHPDRPQFVYWVTLNSHLPVPSMTGVGQDFDCSGNGIGDRDVCVWARLIYNVDRAIAEMASDSAIGPTEFLVVGDHAPPFWRNTRRSLFSQAYVPYFRLIPRP